jgi:dienelactone hydrolase
MIALASGAEARLTGPLDGRAVVCVNGGRAAELPGTWSASVEWLVGRLARRFPRLGFVEVRYRVRSWRRFESCVEDADAALAHVEGAGARGVALLGFSMGAAVAVRVADDPNVSAVIGLGPWLPPELDLSALAAKRFAILHGNLDAPFPGFPGVRPSLSAAAFERARSLGVDASRTVIPGAVHALALRAPGGRPLPMPRAGRWVALVAAELERFCA